MDSYPLWSKYKENVQTDKESLRAMFEALTGKSPQDDYALNISELQRELTQTGHPLADLGLDVFERILAEFQDAPRLLSGFSPGVYEGDVLFFKAAQGSSDEENYDPQLWREYVRGNIIVHDVSCTHNTMFGPEALKTIGPVLKQWVVG